MDWKKYKFLETDSSVTTEVDSNSIARKPESI